MLTCPSWPRAVGLTHRVTGLATAARPSQHRPLPVLHQRHFFTLPRGLFHVTFPGDLQSPAGASPSSGARSGASHLSPAPPADTHVRSLREAPAGSPPESERRRGSGCGEVSAPKRMKSGVKPNGRPERRGLATAPPHPHPPCLETWHRMRVRPSIVPTWDLPPGDPASHPCPQGCHRPGHMP